MTAVPGIDPPDTALAERVRPAALVGLDRVRLLLGAVMGTVLVSYGLLVPVAALVMSTAGGPTSWDAAFATALPLWLAAHQVPLLVDGLPLSVLPLLPTLALIALLAAAARRTSRRLGGRWRTAGGPVVVSTAGAHAAVAVLASALMQPAGPVVAAAPWAAATWAALTCAIGAGLGAFRACGPPAWWAAAPGWLRTGAVAAGMGLAGLATCAVVVLFAALAIAAGDVHQQLDQVDARAGAVLGLTLLSVAYLPNALVAAGSWMLGPGLQVGVAAASALAVQAGPLPAVPLFAAMPIAEPPVWAALALALPMLVGVLVGWCCRAAGDTTVQRLRAVGVASAAVAAGCAAAALVVGGRLAGGLFDPVRLNPAMLACAALLFVGLPALATAARAPRRPTIS